MARVLDSFVGTNLPSDVQRAVNESTHWSKEGGGDYRERQQAAKSAMEIAWMLLVDEISIGCTGDYAELLKARIKEYALSIRRQEDVAPAYGEARAREIAKQLIDGGFQEINIGVRTDGEVRVVRKLECEFRTCPQCDAEGMCKQPQKAKVDVSGRCIVASMILAEEDDA